MQSTDISRDLAHAMEAVEELLNSSEGESFIDAIKKYKQTGEIDNNSLLRLRKYLR